MDSTLNLTRFETKKKKFFSPKKIKLLTAEQSVNHRLNFDDLSGFPAFQDRGSTYI